MTSKSPRKQRKATIDDQHGSHTTYRNFDKNIHFPNPMEFSLDNKQNSKYRL